MLDCTFVLSACWADNTEIVASGTVVGADEAELVSVMLDRHHEDICSVGGTIGGDVLWGIEQWSEAEVLEPLWRHNRDHSTITVPIPCRTSCPDHPDAGSAPSAAQRDVRAMGRRRQTRASHNSDRSVRTPIREAAEAAEASGSLI